MKRLFTLLFAFAMLGISNPQEAQAQEDTSAFELSLFSPVQIAGPENTIKGLRINLLYGRNVALRGLDIGLVNHTTSGPSAGLQYGVLGIAESDFYGWQANLVANSVQGTFKGYQSAIVNHAAMAEGFQFGVVNWTNSVKGFQLGIFNYTENLEGIQVGIGNYARNASGHPFLPIFNWVF